MVFKTVFQLNGTSRWLWLVLHIIGLSMALKELDLVAKLQREILMSGFCCTFPVLHRGFPFGQYTILVCNFGRVLLDPAFSWVFENIFCSTCVYQEISSIFCDAEKLKKASQLYYRGSARLTISQFRSYPKKDKHLTK